MAAATHTALGAEVWHSVLYEEFADGTFDRWTVGSPFYGDPSVPEPPLVAVSAEDYAITGDTNKPVWILRPVTIDQGMEIRLEMYAVSGVGWPNHCSMVLFHNTNTPTENYRGMAYGENELAAFWHNNGAATEPAYDLGEAAHEWHVFRWERDAQGYWSFYLDDELKAPTFVQDARWTSFNAVNLGLGDEDSQIDWVRISVKQTSPATFFAGTGHYYEYVEVPAGCSWTQARAAAEERHCLGCRGHLATIASEVENTFTGIPQRAKSDR